MSNKKIRILYILTNLDVCNGVTSYVMNYYKNMNEEEFEIDFLVCEKAKIDSEYNEEIIKQKKSKIYHIEQIGLKNCLKVLRDMNIFFKENAQNYDIVHCHMLNNGAFFLHYAKKYNLKCRILHSHVTKSADTKLKKIRNDLFVPIAIKNATDYFACSQDAGKFIFGNKNFKVINNAIDGKRFLYDEDIRKKIRNENGINQELVFGNIGRLCPQKNQLFLLDTFFYIKRKLPNSKLVLVGDGVWKEKIQEKIKKINLQDDVILLSSREDIQNIYQAFDIFLFPSVYEGLGIVLIEAQTSGLRCVTSDVIPKEAQICENYRTISLEKKSEFWADQIVEFAKEKYIRKSQYQELVKHNFDITRETEKLEKTYKKIIENNGDI